jgi:hypothetical protein
VACEEKSRKRIVGNSSITWFSVDQVGPAAEALGSAARAKRTHWSANSDAISPTDNAASAGHRKAIDGDGGSGIAITLRLAAPQRVRQIKFEYSRSP